MKKIGVTAVVLIIFGVYAIFYRQSSSSAATTPPTQSTNSNQSPSSNNSGKNGHYKDGAYTGTAADAYYGTVQVKATITNGQLAKVEFLQYPNDQQESVQVNQAAMPSLQQEAIQAQNANVDIVSGATQTSEAFRQSLASALTQAK